MPAQSWSLVRKTKVLIRTAKVPESRSQVKAALAAQRVEQQFLYLMPELEARQENQQSLMPAG